MDLLGWIYEITHKPIAQLTLAELGGLALLVILTVTVTGLVWIFVSAWFETRAKTDEDRWREKRRELGYDTTEDE